MKIVMPKCIVLHMSQQWCWSVGLLLRVQLSRAWFILKEPLIIY